VTVFDLIKEVNKEEPIIRRIDDGEVLEDALNFAGKDSGLLMNELAKVNCKDTREITYGMWSDTEGFFIKIY